MREELARALRVADMLTTCHCVLRDRFARRALILDLMILVASVWLIAMAFVDPEIAKSFALPNFSPTITIGLLAVITFVLSLLQLRTDWKYQSERFDQAAKAYADTKLELRRILNSEIISAEDYSRALQNFSAIGARVAAIPDKQFNALKKKHLLKKRVGQLIDGHPGSNIAVIKLRLWWDDTMSLMSKSPANSSQGQADDIPPQA